MWKGNDPTETGLTISMIIIRSVTGMILQVAGGLVRFGYGK